MKVSKLAIKNFQMLRTIGIEPSAPIVMLAGPNEAGKSSTLDAIRMALTGASARVALKKDYGHLVRDGAEDGEIIVTFEDGRQSKVVLPSGKIEFSGVAPTSDQNEVEKMRQSLPLVIDPHNFAKLDEDSRRQFLFMLTGVTFDSDSVGKRMIAREIDPKKVEAITPMLRSGFPAAHESAQAKIVEARGAWKATTGEVYGVKKAVGWKAKAPEFDALWLTSAIAELAEIERNVDEANSALGKVMAENQAAIDANTKAAGLREKANLKERRLAKFNFDTAEHAAWTERVEATRASNNRPVPLTCPHCSALSQMVHGVLVAYEEPEPINQELVGRLQEYENALALAKSAMLHSERDLKESTDAEAALAALGDLKAPDDAAIETAKATLEQHKRRRAEVSAEVERVRGAQRAAQAAKEVTEKAAEYHADVEEWQKVCDALAPGGIPGELLADAMTPVNNRLRDASIATGWAQVSIDPDMTIRVGGRVYGLLSESAKWRADAVLAETISYLSGLKFFCLDRIDVLDLPNRGACMKWLHGLAGAGDIDTAFVFGTFKSLPGVPSSTFDARWVERGEVYQQADQAAA